MSNHTPESSLRPSGDRGGCETFHPDLVRYVDGETIGPEALERFERHLRACSECRREVAVFRAVKGELATMMDDQRAVPGGSLWKGVRRGITRPIGWVFLVAGALLWTGWAVYSYLKTPTDLMERLASGLVVIGLLVLLASVARERIRDYRTDPYKRIMR
jgi:anti-sigma factor RsiW